MADEPQTVDFSALEEMAAMMTPAQATQLIKGMCIARAALAIKCLTDIVNNPRINPNARVVAANSLLDRGFGKPEQLQTLPVTPGTGRTGVMLVPGTEGEKQWLDLASEHHRKMLQ